MDASTGVITTVAGNGTPGFSGDGGPATSAQLNSPRQIAVDSIRNLLFIADLGNNRVRRVDLGTGIITTAAGDGGPATSAQVGSPQSVAVDATGNFFNRGRQRHSVHRRGTEGWLPMRSWTIRLVLIFPRAEIRYIPLNRVRVGPLDYREPIKRDYS